MLTCFISSTNVNATVDKIFIKHSTDISKQSNSYNAIKLNDEIMIDSKAVELITSTETRYNETQGYIRANNKTAKRTVFVNSHHSNIELMFQLDNNEVDVTKASKPTTITMPKELSPVMIDSIIYLPLNFIYKYTDSDLNTLYNSPDNTLIYGLSQTQKQFLEKFQFSKLRSCKGDDINWDQRAIIFEENNKFGVLDYLGGENNKFARDSEYKDYKIIVEPIYDSISCDSISDGKMIMRKNNKFKLFNRYDYIASNEYDAIKRLKDKIDWLPIDDDRAVEKYFEKNRKTKDAGCGDVVGDFHRGIGEVYLLEKNGKYGISTSSLTTDVIYDKVDVKTRHQKYCGANATFNNVYLYTSNEMFIVVDGNKIINFNEIRSSDKSTLILVLALVATLSGAIAAFVARKVIKAKRKIPVANKDIGDKS